MDSENIKAINESYERLYEDWDKAGVMPHKIMGLSLGNLGLGKTVASAAGLVALAGTGLAKAGLFAGKHILMKTGFLKVLKRIGEIEAYIMKGQNPQKFRFTAQLDGGGSITTARTYDDIKKWMLDGIKEEIAQYKEYNEGEHTSTSKKLNRKAMLVSSVNKYNRFFSNVNKDFSNVKSYSSYGSSNDVYDEFKNVVSQNLTWSEEYVNLLIKKYEKRFTIGKEDSGYNNKRLALYVSSLKQAWTVVKQEILTKYKQLLIDINRSPEFLELYKIVSRAYNNLDRSTPGSTAVLDNIMNLAYANTNGQITFVVESEDRILSKEDRTPIPCIIIEQNVEAQNDSTKNNGITYVSLFQNSMYRPKYITVAANEVANNIKKFLPKNDKTSNIINRGIVPGKITVELFASKENVKIESFDEKSAPSTASRVFFEPNTIDDGVGDHELILNNTDKTIQFKTVTPESSTNATNNTNTNTNTANKPATSTASEKAQIWLKWSCDFSDSKGEKLGTGTVYKPIDIILKPKPTAPIAPNPNTK